MHRLYSPANWPIIGSLIVVLVLAFLPGTGWIIRSQLKAEGDCLKLASVPANWTRDFEGAEDPHLSPLFDDGKSARSSPALARLLRQRPDDYLLQLGAALLQPCAGEGPINIQAQAIRMLENQFPGRPALEAHEIEALIGAREIPALDGEWLLSGRVPPAVQTSSNRLDLAALETAAARGEEMDPDNAFFPMIQSYCLFASHRDREATDAVLRAGRKSRWDSYFHDRACSAIELAARLDGHLPVMRRFILFDNANLSLEPIRSACGSAIWQAIVAEQHGDTDAGLRCRTAAMHVAGRMRVQGIALIENLAGASLVRMCLTRPGGAPPEPRRPKAAALTACRQRLDRFCAYLQRIGHGSDVTWVRREVAGGNAVNEISRRAFTFDRVTRLFLPAVLAWFTAFLLLNEIMLVPISCLIARAVDPTRRRRSRRRPLSPARRARVIRSAAFVRRLHVIIICLYPVLVLYAAHFDTRESQAFDQMLTHEGRYSAASIHREWPGPPDSSPAHQP